MSYRYRVEYFCDECFETHPTKISIEREELIDPKQPIADVYKGIELPTALRLRNNTFTCPNTKKQTTQKDNDKVFLVRET